MQRIHKEKALPGGRPEDLSTRRRIIFMRHRVCAFHLDAGSYPRRPKVSSATQKLLYYPNSHTDARHMKWKKISVTASYNAAIPNITPTATVPVTITATACPKRRPNEPSHSPCPANTTYRLTKNAVSTYA